MRTLAFAITLLSWSAPVGAEEPPKGPPGTVTLPLADYDRLVDRGRDRA